MSNRQHNYHCLLFSHKMEKLIIVYRHDCGIYVTKYMELWNGETLTKLIVAVTAL